MAKTPLILLSGMAADERVFTRQREAFEHLTVPRWIAPGSENESIASYAQRLAARINPGGPCYIGGASFGGFVAIEMCRYLRAKACFLIGSVRSPAELPRRIQMLRALDGTAKWLPFEWICALAASAVASSGRYSSPTTRLLLGQLSESDANFLRWATQAVLRWQASEPPDVPIYHIHGGRDHILPVSFTHADRIVRNAGHVLSITHPDEVNAFLREHMK